MTQSRINIIDATPIEAAQSGSGKGKNGEPRKDSEAGWHVKNDSCGRQKSTYGYSVHTGVYEDDFMHNQSVTPGNVHENQDVIICHLEMKKRSMWMQPIVFKTHRIR
jgi:IS5 family transposase